MDNIPLAWGTQIGTVHRNVAGPVEALCRDEGVEDERLLGLFRLVEIPASELNAADEGRAQALVKNVQSVVGERATNETGEGNIRILRLTKNGREKDCLADG